MQRLVAAVGAVIRKQGFSAVGVNTVSREAGVDKVLLYRYFGNLETLLKEYVSASDYYKTAASLAPPSIDHYTRKDFQKAGSQIILGQLRRLRATPDLQEIYRWELNTDNPVTRSLAEQREREGTALLSMFAKRIDFSRTDLPAIVSVILAGGIYLILRTRSARVFNGVDLETQDGWRRIERAIDTILGLAADTFSIAAPGSTRQPGHRPYGNRKPRGARRRGAPTRASRSRTTH